MFECGVVGGVRRRCWLGKWRGKVEKEGVVVNSKMGRMVFVVVKMKRWRKMEVWVVFVVVLVEFVVKKMAVVLVEER